MSKCTLKQDRLQIRIESDIKTRLENKHPHKNEVSKIVRGLIKMYLNGKINRIEYIENI